MKNYSRRNWLGNAALLGSALLMHPSQTLAIPTARQTLNLRLNANENPFGPSARALEAIQNKIRGSNLYPFDTANQLIADLAAYHGFTDAQFMLGAGSTQLLKLLAQWSLNNRFTVTYAAPTFDILPRYVDRMAGKTQATPLTREMVHDLPAIEKASKNHPGLVYVVNPNNPTGTKADRAELIAFCRRVSQHSYVVIDEAYIEYIAEAESVKSLVRDNPKVIVLRTFSKIYALAGLRIGYLMAHPETISELNKLTIWPNSDQNSAGIAAARASLGDKAFLVSSRQKTAQSQAYLQKQLDHMGIRYITPQANFLFMEVSPFSQQYDMEMKRRNISLRSRPVGAEQWVRVSMGTLSELEQFVEILKKVHA